MALLKIRNQADDAWIEVGGVLEVIQQDSEPATTYPGQLWLDTDEPTLLGAQISDLDGDTKVQCEESDDEDKIRFDTGGTQRLLLDSYAAQFAGDCMVVEGGTDAVPTDAMINEHNPLAVYNDNDSGVWTGINFRVADNNAAVGIIALEKDASRTGDFIFRLRTGASTSSEVLRLAHDSGAFLLSAASYRTLNLTEVAVDETLQRTGITGKSWKDGEEDVGMIHHRSDETSNVIALGGYTSTVNGPTNIQMMTTPAVNELGGNLAFDVSGDGEVTLPLQPSFWAYQSATQNNVSTGAYHVVEYDVTNHDIGDNFNTSTYTFTAPVDGKYHFNVQVYLNSWDANAGYYILTLKTDQYTAARIYAGSLYDDNDSTLSLNVSVAVPMDASDTAYVTFYQSAGAAQTDIIHNSSYGWFRGYLLG